MKHLMWGWGSNCKKEEERNGHLYGDNLEFSIRLN
jgi:hypothetical protein